MLLAYKLIPLYAEEIIIYHEDQTCEEQTVRGYPRSSSSASWLQRQLSLNPFRYFKSLDFSLLFSHWKMLQKHAYLRVKIFFLGWRYEECIHFWQYFFLTRADFSKVVWNHNNFFYHLNWFCLKKQKTPTKQKNWSVQANMNIEKQVPPFKTTCCKHQPVGHRVVSKCCAWASKLYHRGKFINLNNVMSSCKYIAFKLILKHS